MKNISSSNYIIFIHKIIIFESKILVWANLFKVGGDKFDIKDFHDHILSFGSIPMSILEEKVDEFIEAKSNWAFQIVIFVLFPQESK